MDELAESRMETDAFKQFLEKQIKYPGEETFDEYRKRKASSDPSDSDTS